MRTRPKTMRELAAIHYRLRRTGRKEWLDWQASPTEDAERAAEFPTATDAMLFALEYTDEPQLWEWEPFTSTLTVSPSLQSSEV